MRAEIEYQLIHALLANKFYQGILEHLDRQAESAIKEALNTDNEELIVESVRRAKGMTDARKTISAFIGNHKQRIEHDLPKPG